MEVWQPPLYGEKPGQERPRPTGGKDEHHQTFSFKLKRHGYFLKPNAGGDIFITGFLRKVLENHGGSYWIAHSCSANIALKYDPQSCEKYIFTVF